MGASGWDYYARYQPDIEAVFAQLQDEVLQSGDFLWNDEWYGPRPTTRWQLSAVKDRDEFWDEGTHSILDMDGSSRPMPRMRPAPPFADRGRDGG